MSSKRLYPANPEPSQIRQKSSKHFYQPTQPNDKQMFLSSQPQPKPCRSLIRGVSETGLWESRIPPILVQ